jgi:AcrR family transcriptional regulator
MPKKPKASHRKEASEQRRQAILEAGLTVFAAEGFAAARLDDVAEKAGVAKGTIYFSFKDKEDLFEQIVLGALTPLLDRLDLFVSEADLPFEDLLTRLFEVFQTEILATRRREIIRLVIAEGARFPRIAEFYHRQVIAKGLALVRSIAKRAHQRGELSSAALERFPHLIFAPLLTAVIWQSVFSKIEPLDIKGLLAAHHEILLANGKPRRSGK